MTRIKLKTFQKNLYCSQILMWSHFAPAQKLLILAEFEFMCWKRCCSNYDESPRNFDTGMLNRNVTSCPNGGSTRRSYRARQVEAHLMQTSIKERRKSKVDWKCLSENSIKDCYLSTKGYRSIVFNLTTYTQRSMFINLTKKEYASWQ